MKNTITLTKEQKIFQDLGEEIGYNTAIEKEIEKNKKLRELYKRKIRKELIEKFRLKEELRVYCGKEFKSREHIRKVRGIKTKIKTIYVCGESKSGIIQECSKCAKNKKYLEIIDKVFLECFGLAGDS